MRALGNSGSHCTHCVGLHFASPNRPKDVQGCPAAPEELSFTAFLALFLFLRFPTCVCVCVCVCVQVCCVLLHSTACTSVLRVLSDWTLDAAAYPSKKLVMSVRCHTKVLADGEG